MPEMSGSAPAARDAAAKDTHEAAVKATARILQIRFIAIRPRSSVRVTELQHSRLRAVDGALLQPFERSFEEQQMVLFPHRIVRRAGEVDENFVAGA